VVAPLVLGLSLGDRRLRAVSLFVGAVALGYGVTQGPLALSMADPPPYEGLAERVILALLLVEVTLIARTLAHCTTSASADPVPPPQYHYVWSPGMTPGPPPFPHSIFRSRKKRYERTINEATQ
jgi:hypothetical protein